MDIASLALLAQSSRAQLQQSIFIRQLLETSGTLMLQIVLMVILYWIITYKSDKIRHPLLIRWSYRLLVASLVVPMLLYLFLGMFVSSDFFALALPLSTSGRGLPDSWLLAPGLIGPILLAASLYLGFASLDLGPIKEPRRKTKPAVPQKHPLD